MKRLILTVTCCCLLALPGLALAEEPSTSEPAPSLDELEQAIFAPTAPEPNAMSGPCYVKEYCDGGGYVACTGSSPSSVCSAGPEYVECDGERTECPCTASILCPDGSRTVSCTGGGWVNECEEGWNFVNCNEQYTYCPWTCMASCEGGFPSCKGYSGPNACFTKYGSGTETFYIECDGQRIDCNEPLF